MLTLLLPVLFPLAVSEALVVGGVGRGGRIPFAPDAVTAAVVEGRWKAPAEGEAVVLPSGSERKWTKIAANADGWFEHQALGGGYAFVRTQSAAEKIVILEAAGHSMVYVNGVPRTGDPYQYGYVKLPIKLKAGDNDFLFSCGRGRLRVDFSEPKAPLSFNTGDVTLPDAIPGDKGDLMGAVPVVNATDAMVSGYTLEAKVGGTTLRTSGGAILPLGVRKAMFRFPVPQGTADTADIELKIVQNGKVLDSQTLKVRVRKEGQTYRRTFLSRVDGSLQYYAVVPQTKPTPNSALVLTLHGASVEAQGQADAYAPKDWCTIVAATNRRPYGFDWEEIGRLDAMEVLAEAKKRFQPDPNRIYLTGHSMGGHGTWQVGVQYPDLFAGIAPSAGWISFFSYAGGSRNANAGPVEEIVQRAASPSDTLSLSRNYLSYPIYILHGDADDNVPVTEARTMRDHLKDFHPHVEYHEQPGAGHWWGNQCVDWPGIFDMFKKSVRPERTEIDYTTNSLSVNNRYAWATIDRQQKALASTRIQLKADRAGRRIEGTTTNVARLVLDLETAIPGKGPRTVVLDGQELKVNAKSASFINLGGQWTYATQMDGSGKTGAFTGPFKNAFNERMVFVYGTKGTAEENAWMFAKARFDAETLWYRGNGAVDVVPDTGYSASKFKDRNVILYGNSVSNSAWSKLLANCPIKVGRAGILAGARSYLGDRAVMLIYPSAQGRCLVGAIGGTTVAGMRLTDRAPYFSSGVQLPDYAVFDSNVYRDGAAAVLEAGYFGNDWSLERGERAWKN
ncbi:MAG: prolyl oligopeptidase family serine peptidase [Fimbriimonadales bacterium]